MIRFNTIFNNSLVISRQQIHLSMCLLDFPNKSSKHLTAFPQRQMSAVAFTFITTNVGRASGLNSLRTDPPLPWSLYYCYLNYTLISYTTVFTDMAIKKERGDIEFPSSEAQQLTASIDIGSADITIPVETLRKKGKT